VIQLKGEATQQLEREGIHPLAPFKIGVPRAIEYVVNNPLKEGKKKQKWSFVVRYA
jgi:hypothetical protein